MVLRAERCRIIRGIDRSDKFLCAVPIAQAVGLYGSQMRAACDGANLMSGMGQTCGQQSTDGPGTDNTNFHEVDGWLRGKSIINPRCLCEQLRIAIVETDEL